MATHWAALALALGFTVARTVTFCCFFFSLSFWAAFWRTPSSDFLFFSLWCFESSAFTSAVLDVAVQFGSGSPPFAGGKATHLDFAVVAFVTGRVCDVGIELRSAAFSDAASAALLRCHRAVDLHVVRAD